MRILACIGLVVATIILAEAAAVFLSYGLLSLLERMLRREEEVEEGESADE